MSARGLSPTRSTGPMTAARAAGTSDAQAQAIRQLGMSADIELLTSAPIDFLVVKGPVLAAAYPRPADRRYSDLDIVVASHAVDDVIRAITDLGGQLLDANWDAALRDRWGQVHLRMPHGTLLDLHWHLINMGRVRDTLAVDMDDVWRGLRTVPVPGGSVRTLSVTNTVVHVALHAALGGAWQPRWFADVAAVVAAEDVDWDAVVARARTWRVARLVGVALYRACTGGGADVPSAILSALLPPPLTPAVVTRLDRWWPTTGATRDCSVARLWPHLVRDDWRAVGRAAAWRVERRLRNGPRGFWHGRAMPHETVPTGGDAARSRFLASVRTGAWY